MIFMILMQRFMLTNHTLTRRGPQQSAQGKQSCSRHQVQSKKSSFCYCSLGFWLQSLCTPFGFSLCPWIPECRRYQSMSMGDRGPQLFRDSRERSCVAAVLGAAAAFQRRRSSSLHDVRLMNSRYLCYFRASAHWLLLSLVGL